jgi:hypothetical protein
MLKNNINRLSFWVENILLSTCLFKKKDSKKKKTWMKQATNG